MGNGRHRGGLILIGLILVTGVACGSSVPSPSDWAVTIDSVPGEDRIALDECMAAAGFIVHPAETGSNAVYSWERPSSYTWAVEKGMPDGEAAKACRARFASPREKTEAELREIYRRWLLERDCLISLGFTPRKPPSFEAFVRTWKRGGPWMPIDGIPFDQLRGEPMRLCGLEMVN